MGFGWHLRTAISQRPRIRLRRWKGPHDSASQDLFGNVCIISSKQVCANLGPKGCQTWPKIPCGQHVQGSSVAKTHGIEKGSVSSSIHTPLIGSVSLVCHLRQRIHYVQGRGSSGASHLVKMAKVGGGGDPSPLEHPQRRVPSCPPLTTGYMRVLDTLGRRSHGQTTLATYVDGLMSGSGPP